MRKTLELPKVAESVLEQMNGPGALLTAVDEKGATNVMTIGWGLLGQSYRGHPMFVIAVCPARFTWRFLEATDEFVVAVGEGPGYKAAAALCGAQSGRDMDKFEAAGLTAVPSVHVRAPSIRECCVNIECHTYHRQRPPHMILTPQHRQRPLAQQHTIYFAEVLGVYSGKEGEQ